MQSIQESRAIAGKIARCRIKCGGTTRVLHYITGSLVNQLDSGINYRQSRNMASIIVLYHWSEITVDQSQPLTIVAYIIEKKKNTCELKTKTKKAAPWRRHSNEG